MRDDLDSLLAFVRKAARKYSRTSLGYDDAVGVGNLAVAEALRTYDPETGVPLSAYVIPRVRWAMSEAQRRTHGKKGHPDMEAPVEDEFLTGLAIHRDNYHTFYDVLMRLRPVVREVVLLAASGWTHPEIGARFGFSDSRSCQLLAEGRRYVAAELGWAA